MGVSVLHTTIVSTESRPLSLDRSRGSKNTENFGEAIMKSTHTISIVTIALVVFVSGVVSRYACRHGNVAYDRCGQRCVCRYGRLRDCTRFRKEFTTMNYFERRRFVRTILIASTHPKYKAEYDKLIGEHRTLFFTGIHQVDHFLPWHRYYLLQYENLLRKINCRFTAAYWDWGMDSGHPFRGLYRDVWFPGRTGLGGNGAGANQCVNTGLFREGRWTLTPSASSRCLQRNFNGNTPDTIAIMQLLMTPSTQFFNFEAALRIDFHGNVHCLIDGTMCSIDSSNAPEFFLHHGFVDKIWADWQKKSSSHKNAHFPTIMMNMPGKPYRPGAFVDLAKHPGGVRVDYQELVATTNLKKKYRGYSVTRLSRLPGRHAFSFANKKAMKVFRVTPAEREMARKMAAKFSPPSLARGK